MSVFDVPVTSASPGIDAAEVRRAVELFADAGNGFVLVTIKGGRAHGHAFFGSDVEAAVTMAGVLDRALPDGVYFTLNPVARNFGGTSDTCVAKNEDILSRRWLLVDVDTKRPDKTKQGATEEEREASRLVADAVAAHLSALGWPPPVRTDSGNGWHLFYPCDLPNDDDTRRVVLAWLKRLKAQFENDAAEIDTKVGPAKQIAKLPGSWARKGGNQQDRPWRRCRFIEVPDQPRTAVVTAAMLGPPAEPSLPPEQPATPGPAPSANGHGVFAPTVNKGPDRRLAYCRQALESERAKVAGTRIGTGLNQQLNDSAFALGQLCPPLTEADVFAVLYGACIQAGGDNPGKDQDTLRRGIRAGMEQPRDLAFLDDPPSTGGQPQGTPSAGPDWGVIFDGEVVAEGTETDLDALGVTTVEKRFRRFEVLSFERLLTTEYPDPQWAIHGLLAEGLNLLAGNPKSGKSFLALNLCLTVAGGGLALGSMPTTPGDVLYLSLEDQFRRVQRRAKKMTRLLTDEAQRRLSVVTQWPAAHKGGLSLLEHWLRRVQAPRLLVIDVLGKFRPASIGKASAYQEDSEQMYRLKEFADRHGITLLVLHHTRKKLGGKNGDDSVDEFESISGTQGIAGGCDGLIVMVRQRGTTNATIALTSRDDEEQKLQLQFDPETLTWRSLGTVDQIVRGMLQTKVLEYMRIRPGAILHGPGIAAAIEANGDAVRVILHRLENKGLIARVGNGWSFPVGGKAPVSEDRPRGPEPQFDPEPPPEFAEGDAAE